jgi:hypothetical protein
MSLKAFHIFFISLSVALAIGFSVWLLRSYERTGDGWTLAGSLASLLAAAGLVAYGIRILKKLRHVSYL